MSIIKLIQRSGETYYGPGKKRDLEKFLREKGFERSKGTNSWGKDPEGNLGLVQALLLPANPLRDFPETFDPI